MKKEKAHSVNDLNNTEFELVIASDKMFLGLR